MKQRKPQTRQEFIERESLAWLDLILPAVELPDAVWTRPGAAGDWSLKDVWAHIADWMHETRRVMPILLTGRRVRANLRAFNREHYERNRKLTPDAARRRFERERKQLRSLIKKIPAEQLLGNRQVYSWASYATYNHYAEHTPGVVRFARLMKRQLRQGKQVARHASTSRAR